MLNQGKQWAVILIWRFLDSLSDYLAPTGLLRLPVPSCFGYMPTFRRWNSPWPDSVQRRITMASVMSPPSSVHLNFWWACLYSFCWTSIKTSSSLYLFSSTSSSYSIFAPPDQSFSWLLPCCSIFPTYPSPKSSLVCSNWIWHHSCYTDLLHIMVSLSEMKLFPWLIHLNMSFMGIF